MLRQTPDLTVATLRQELRDRDGNVRVEDAPTDTIRFALDADEPTIAWRGHELPATEEGILAFGAHLKVPGPFLKRTSPYLQQQILSEMIQTERDSALRIRYTPGQSISQVLKTGKLVIDPVSVVDVAGRVLGSDSSEITRLVNNQDEFSIDVRVPESHDRGVGGDLPSTNQVGDITTGGITLSVDRKHNLSPSVQPYLYRLVCTNGMVTRDPGLRMDARGQSVEEVLAELEVLAERAFSRVEPQIDALYDLRTQRVDNPERVLVAIAREQRLPNRALTSLVQLAASEDLGDHPTMFDVINLVTNFANSAANPGGRLRLESAAGAVINDHAARCEHCQTRLLN